MKPFERNIRLAMRSIAVPAIAAAFVTPLPALAAGPVGAAQHAAAKPAAAKQKHVARAHHTYRASELIGKEVRSKENVDIGRITDLVLNMTTGDVRYAVLSLHGEIGPGEPRLYAISVKSLAPGARRGDLVLAMDARKWRERAGFPAARWPDLRDSGYWNEIDRVSGVPAVQPAEAYFAYRASELIGKDVQNYDGHKLGAVRDLVIDMNRQAVRYVALEFEPGATTTGKLYSFPVSAFAFPEDTKGKFSTGKLVLDVEPSDLSTMKSFDAAHWPGLGAARHMASNDIR
jgi:sporulation protein YlmC with PRC-barrel domain